MSPGSNRVLAGIVFAALWTAGMLLRAPAIDTQAIVVAGLTGAITGLLMYWLFDKLRGPFRG